MCKEGIRIGRRTFTKSQQATAQSFTAGPASIGPNPMRIGVALTIQTNGFVYGDSIQIGFTEATAFIPIAAVTADNPTIFLSIEQWGQFVIGALSVMSDAALPTAYTIMEFILTEDLKTL